MAKRNRSEASRDRNSRPERKAEVTPVDRDPQPVSQPTVPTKTVEQATSDRDEEKKVRDLISTIETAIPEVQKEAGATKGASPAETAKKVGYLSTLLTQSKTWLRDKTGTIGGVGGFGGSGAPASSGFLSKIFKGIWEVAKFPFIVAGGAVLAVSMALSKIGMSSSDKKH